MKNSDSMKRMKAMAETIDKIMKEQEKQKAQEAVEAENDDMDLAADLLVQAASLLKGEEIEADCCFPCCVVEVFCDDEL